MTTAARHRLDNAGAALRRRVSPAARVLTGVLLVASIATTHVGSRNALGLSAVVFLTALLWAKPRPSVFARRALPALLVISALVLPLLLTGQANRAFGMGARAAMAVGVALAVAATLTLEELPGALSALGIPAGLCAVVETMLRQLGSVKEEGRRIVLARRLRGASGWGVGPEVLAALLSRTSARAERVELAMRLRGYAPDAARDKVKLAPRDAPLLALAALVAVLLHLAA